VMLSDGTKIPTHTVIWAGGLKAASLSNNVGAKTGRGGRIDVQADLTVPGLTSVYALGDFANIAGKDGKPSWSGRGTISEWPAAMRFLTTGKNCRSTGTMTGKTERPRSVDNDDVWWLGRWRRGVRARG
jgi:hypothetical protein